MNGKSRFIETHADDWQWIKGHDDIAAVDVTDRLNKLDDAISIIPKGLLLSKEFIAQTEFGIGEKDGFMLGLFSKIPGKKRNLVAARFGNVSLLADDDTPVKQPNGSMRPSHIFDLRSRPGFSGSPVFVYRTSAGDLRDTTVYQPPQPRHMIEITSKNKDELETAAAIARAEASKNVFIRLLGIHAGQYHDAVRTFKDDSAPAESDSIIREGDVLNIPNSMAIVVPAWEILKLLDLSTFQEQRGQREEMMRAKRNTTDEAEPETTGDLRRFGRRRQSTSPRVFTRLEDVAARKRPQGDQT